MAEIIKQKYHDHPQIAVIEQCLEDAIALRSDIPAECFQVSGMSGYVYRRFINNYVRTLTNPRYLEIGTWQGSTLCAATGGIPNIQGVGVDNFTLDGGSYDACLENIAKTRHESSDVVVLNTNFEDFDYSAYGKFDVYMYDGWHSEQAQYDGIVRAKPALAEVSLVVVDDWNNYYIFNGSPTNWPTEHHSQVKVGTYNGFADAGLELLYKIEIETGENPAGASDWHNGYGIFLVRNPG